MEWLNDVKREHIEETGEDLDPNPDPGWNELEETVREARTRGGEANHPQGSAPENAGVEPEVVPRSGDLTAPAATESDSY